MAAASKNTAAQSKQSVACAAFIECNTLGNAPTVDPVAQARAELQAAGDGVKVASRALVLAQRRAEDARVGLARAIEDRSLVEGV